VAKEVLLSNAAAVIFTHNHPSGLAQPSDADKRITDRLIEGLKLFDVRTLDHIIVSHNETYSFAEHGLL
jgi:DNA repair protein RadC